MFCRCVLNSAMISALYAGGCLLTSCGHDPYVSVGNPKVYGDSQTRMLLDQLQKDVRSNLPSITDTTPQKVSRIQQEYGKLFSFKVEPMPVAPAVSTASSDTMLRLPPMQFPSAVDATSLGFTQILRERIRRQQDISRHEILYTGDQDFLIEEKILYLIRVDMGILISKASDEYLMVNFLLKPCSRNGTDVTEEDKNFVRNIKVYALAPEYASSLSKDSFLSRGMKELNGAMTANIKGFNVTAEGDLEKQLDQYLTSTNETPLQFAIPRPRKFNKTDMPKAKLQIKRENNEAGDHNSCNPFFGPVDYQVKLPWYNPRGWFDDSSFTEKRMYSYPEYAFGFGPQRSVYKRSWTNPRRWFGDTYIIENEYIPTVADCYVLIVVDKSFFKNDKSACLKLEVNGGILSGLSGKVDWNTLNSENIGEFILDLRQKEVGEPSTWVLRLLCDRGSDVFSFLKDRLPAAVSEYNKELKAKTEAMNAAGIKEDASLERTIETLEENYRTACKNCNPADEKSIKEKQTAKENLDKGKQAKVAQKNYSKAKQDLSDSLGGCRKQLQTFDNEHGEEMKKAAGKPLEDIYIKYIACKKSVDAMMNKTAAGLNNDEPKEISIKNEYGEFAFALDTFKFMYFNQTGAPVSPGIIDPSVNSTIVIRTRKLPVTPATFLTIDGIMVPSSNINALGKHMFMATIPASGSLQKLPDDSAVCVVTTPGMQECEYHMLKIRKNGDNGTSKKPPLTLSPDKGRIGESVTITSSNTDTCPLSSVTSVLFGNKVIPQGSFLFQSDKKLIFNVPEPDKDIAASVGVAVLPQLSSAPDMKFTYLVPLTAVSQNRKASEK